TSASSVRPPLRPTTGPARTPRCPRTSGDPPPPRRRWHGSGRRASDSNGEKNNELGSRPQFRRIFPSRNPSSRGRVEKTHSRTVIENKNPRDREASLESLGTSRLPSFARASLNICRLEDRCFFLSCYRNPVPYSASPLHPPDSLHEPTFERL